MDSVVKSINQSLLANAPQTIPFEIRAYFFRQLVQAEREQRQHHSMFGILGVEGLEIRREFILEDAFRELYHKGGEGMKDRLRIQFVDTNYVIEEGVDGGGLTKEFITKVTEQIFDPHFAFFTETPLEHKLYPNYLSARSHHNYIDLFRFFGMLVGKSIYEGILLKAYFARFFLNKFSGTGGNQMDEL
jgi:ubiquitin-protein ligase E3 C